MITIDPGNENLQITMTNIWDRLGHLFLESLVLFAVCLKSVQRINYRLILISEYFSTSDNIDNDVRGGQVFRRNEKCYGYKF